MFLVLNSHWVDTYILEEWCMINIQIQSSYLGHVSKMNDIIEKTKQMIHSAGL